MNATARVRPLRGSLRARLTLSYAVVAAALLAVILFGVLVITVQACLRSTMTIVDAATTRTERLYANHQYLSDAQLFALIDRSITERGIRIERHLVRPPDAKRPRNGVIAGGRGPRGRTVDSLFGRQTRIVWLHAGAVFIEPSLRLEALLGLIGLGIVAILTTSTSAGRAIGRSISQQAILPLTTVTRELRRFASGDFTPSVLSTTDATELGALVVAFNGAASQVASAFLERERTEQHLRVFLGEAGHEMRTPLTVISAYLELLDRTDGEHVSVPGDVYATLRGETQRLRELVERVMALARMEGNDLSRAEPVDIVEIARDSISSVARVEPIDVVLDVPAEDVFVLAEPWELGEVLRNLVENAARYGGSTPIDVEIAIDDDDRHVVVRVRDRGPGIAESERSRIFSHFYRGAHAAGKPGTGLGLAIASRAAERLGGKLVLEGGEPGDTVFRLAVPTYRARMEAMSTHAG